MRFLLDSGADVNGSNNDGQTALMSATGQGWAEGVKLLLGSGAEPNAKHLYQSTALHEACHTQSDDLDAFSESCAGLLLEAGADIGARDLGGYTPLLAALQCGNLRLGEWLLQRGASDRVADNLGRTPLILSVRYDDAGHIVRYLLELGASPNAVDTHGVSALMVAAEHGHNEEVIKLLLKHGADVNAVDKFGLSALMAATEYGRNEEVFKLLLKYGADVNLVDMKGQSALMVAITYSQDEEVIELLLKYGADVNAADNTGRTVLMNAVKSFEVTEILLQCGADVNSVDKEGKTAVMMAIELYQGWKAWEDIRDIMRILLSAGLNEQNRKKALELACSLPGPNKELVQILSTPTQAAATTEARLGT